jgi:hypothetical protein
MKNHIHNLRLSGMLLAVLALIWLAGCGGGGATGLSSDTSSSGNSSASDVRALPTGTAVPDIPSDTLQSTSTRGVSDVGTQEYTGSGSALLNYVGGEVQGDSLVLTSTADSIAWALYHVDGLEGLHVSQLSASTQLGAEDFKYGIGASNYSSGVWKWLAYTDQAEPTIDLSHNGHRLVSLLGNLYWVFVVPAGGHTLTVDKSSLVIDDKDGWMPGMGNYLFASKGLPSEIDLEWGVSAGATSYELYRREATKPDHGDDGAILPEFALLATTDATTYVDTAVTVGVWYEYKVRPLNDEGAGDYSHSALGVAADPNAAAPDFSGWGKITAITATGITLDMRRGSSYWTLNEATEYIAADGSTATLDYFQPDMFVFVKGELPDAAAPPVALSITEVTGQGHNSGHNQVQQDASACGALTEIGTDSLVLTPDWPKAADNLTFVLTTDTAYFDKTGAPVEAAYFTAGLRVFVRATFDADGLRVAKAVMEARDENPGGGGGGGNCNPALVAGAITALDDASITVTDSAGTAFTVGLTAETLWLALDGAPLDPTQFAVGDTVVVFTVPNPDDPVAFAVQKYDGTSLPEPPSHPGGGGGGMM